MNKNLKIYFEAVKYVESLFNIPLEDKHSTDDGGKICLDRFNYLLKLLGNPHKNLNYIHVGGTSGKGSVATMIHNILNTAGYKPGLYLSPHPTTSIERIQVGNLLISPSEFAQIVQSLKPILDRYYQKSPYGRPSYFEIMTAIAFIYFKQKKCDYVILEVGLGGRYDATNVIARPKITVINLIDYDHTEILGKNLPDIAKEKAGIIKNKTNFFTTAKNKSLVLKIFEKACKRNNAEFNVIDFKKSDFRLNLLGKHQQQNAALAAAVGEKLGVTQRIIRRALRQTKMSCRFEIIQKKPLVVLDGAHNRSKMKTVVENLKNLTYKKLYLIIGLTSERDPNDIFKDITPLAHRVFITRYQATKRRCYPPKKLAEKIKTGKPAEIFLDSTMALNRALKLAGKNDLILVTGSFYLAGEVRRHWRPEIKILKERKI